MNPPLPDLNELKTPWVLVEPGPQVRSNIKPECLPHLCLLLRQAEKLMVEKSMQPVSPTVHPVPTGAQVSGLEKFFHSLKGNGRRE